MPFPEVPDSRRPPSLSGSRDKDGQRDSLYGRRDAFRASSMRHLGTGAGDRSLKVQMTVALVAGLVLVSVPLYFFRRPRDAGDARGAASASPSGSATPSTTASSIATSIPIVPPDQPGKSLTLGDAKILRCSKAGTGKTQPEQCDRLPFFEEALAKAIRDNASCAPQTATGGTVSFVLDVDFKQKRTKLWTGKSGSLKKKQTKELTGCVLRALPSTDWSQVPHQHTKYSFSILATYPPGSGGSSGVGGPLGRASPRNGTTLGRDGLVGAACAAPFVSRCCGGGHRSARRSVSRLAPFGGSRVARWPAGRSRPCGGAFGGPPTGRCSPR